MSRRQQLQTAILELLEEESGSPSQVRQRLEDAGAPFKAETVITALQALQRLGQVIHTADGLYARAENPGPRPKPQLSVVPTEPSASSNSEKAAEPAAAETKPGARGRQAPVRKGSAMATKKCPACKKTKPESEFHSNGYCKPCGRAKSQKYYEARKAGAQRAAPKASPVKPRAKAANGEDVVVTQTFTLVLRDADGKRHSFRLTEESIERLKAAIGAVAS